MRNLETYMTRNMSVASPIELQRLLQLTARVGSDPLLTQASTGNSSIKIDGVLWMKASGKWMADATREDILIPLDWLEITGDCLQQNVNPAERYPGASVETAMHAVLPHSVVLHLHCVNTVAWAVRADAPVQLQRLLDGLRWQWIPYVASGLPLAHALNKALNAHPDTDMFILGNHGLVIGGEDCRAIDNLLAEIERRLAIHPRVAHPADYTALMEICQDSPWDLPDDDDLHALGTDAASHSILSGGLLYPCQTIFSNATTLELFQAIPYSDLNQRQSRYHDRPFLIVEGRGVVVGRDMTPAELAMVSGLAQVVQRIDPSAPLRYLTETEVATSSRLIAGHYRDLANERVNGVPINQPLENAGTYR